MAEVNTGAANPQVGANKSQPFRSEANPTPLAAVSRRSPWLLNGVPAMELIPYRTFSALRIGEFLPVDAYSEGDGLEQSILGFNGCRHYYMAKNGWLLFHYPDQPPKLLAAIDVSLHEQGLPREVADAVLASCAPPLKFGMEVLQVREVLDAPEFEDFGVGGSGFQRFRVGERWPYRVGCTFQGATGLVGVWIVRGDYFKEDDV